MSVELLDEEENPILGYSGKDAATSTGIDDLRWQPRWKGKADLSLLKNQTVRLRITLRNASVYSVQVQ